ncbi:hypothetical protein HLRTI_002875 [Halorhabdus tiamatea SARL4B]|uniref:Uncharacterized protein n=1 Tax=Halorhabdus tiamatea SARL4B TaxID=1033806 RepID=S6CSP8_9EURY|nr:hypothetical protein HLRTI_002875 [Halorhabdus tiamatea SARL4B]CCQ32297.1 hypothetical protein HTIA_0146 [Halorhabdus tiamatea SARL4B]
MAIEQRGGSLTEPSVSNIFNLPMSGGVGRDSHGKSTDFSGTEGHA